MENTEMLELWKAYGKKLEESLSLNQKNAIDLTNLKVQSFLNSVKPVKILAIAVGILWVGFIDTLILHLWAIASPFFLVSAIIQVLLTKLAIGLYVYQLVLIQQVDISAPIVATQEKIAGLIASTLWVARLLFLQLPVWTIFYWNKTMLENGNTVLWVIQASVTIGLTGLALWLFWNIQYKNKEKKWFKLFFNGPEWTPVFKAMELLNQLNAFKKEAGVL